MTTYALTDPPLPGTTNARRLTCPAGQSLLLRHGRPSCAVSVVPAEGGTALVEVTASPSDVAPDACLWHALGDASASPELHGLLFPVAAVRITASAAAAVVEIVA